jgi:hypothetical protein
MAVRRADDGHVQAAGHAEIVHEPPRPGHQPRVLAAADHLPGVLRHYAALSTSPMALSTPDDVKVISPAISART